MAIAFVQQATATQAAGTTATATLGASPTSNNTLVACIASGAGDVSGVSGGGVTTWTKLKGPGPISSAWANIYFGVVDTTPSTSVTATATSGTIALNVSEWSGIKTSGAADASTAQAQGPSTTPAAGPVTAASGPCLYLGAETSGQDLSAGPTDGFTALTAANGGGRRVQGVYRIDSGTPASATPGLTLGGSVSWDMVVGALLGDAPPPSTGTVTMTDRGTGGNNTGATSLTITPGSNLAVGSMGVLAIAADNAGSGGATAVCPTSITDSAGNVWTRRLNPIYDPGLASAGVELGLYTAPLVFGLTTAQNITVSWAAGVSVTAKCWALHELSIVGGTMDYVTGAAGTGAASATPTVTTSSLTNGDIVIGAGAAESADTWAGDADTTNGTWSTHQHTAFGTGTSGMSLTTQRKQVTATATQTYNPTLTSADQILGWISIRPNVLVRPDQRPMSALQAGTRAGVL